MDKNTNKNLNDENQNSGGILFKKGDEDLGIGELGNSEIGDHISQVKAFAVKQKLLHIKEDIDDLLKVLEQDSQLKDYEEKLGKHIPYRKEEFFKAVKTIEGIFDGTRMVGEDGEKYDIPPNYASKSKLVEGDMLKLRILDNGRFIYKQIEKAARKNAAGKLLYYEDTKEYFVILENGNKYKVLPASVTYYRAVPGDEVIITIPASGESAWAAVEGIRKKDVI